MKAAVLSGIALAGLFSFVDVKAAQATPLTWSFDRATFVGGGSVTGSFTFDVDTNALTNVSFATTPSSAFQGANYSSFDTTFPPNAGAIFFTTGSLAAGSPIFFLQPDVALTDQGGAQHYTASESICQNEGCSMIDPLRMGEGYVSTLPLGVTPIPEPGSIMLLATGIAGAALSRLRMRKRT